MAYQHSGFGISSFILSIIAGLGIAVTFTGLVVAQIQNGVIDERSPAMIGLGCLIISCIGCDLLALIFGCCGLFQPQRNKIFAILGIAFSTITLLGLAGLMIFGLMTSMPN